MDASTVKNMILHDACFQNFINNSRASMCVEIGTIPIIIFKEDVGINFYFRLPRQSDTDYSEVYEFMRHAYPILSTLLEQKRKESLLGPGNIGTATLSH